MVARVRVGRAQPRERGRHRVPWQRHRDGRLQRSRGDRVLGGRLHRPRVPVRRGQQPLLPRLGRRALPRLVGLEALRAARAHAARRRSHHGDTVLRHHRRQLVRRAVARPEPRRAGARRRVLGLPVLREEPRRVVAGRRLRAVQRVRGGQRQQRVPQPRALQHQLLRLRRLRGRGPVRLGVRRLGARRSGGPDRQGHAHQEATAGALASPSGGPGAAFRRPTEGFRYFVIHLDVASRSVQLAIVHPEAVPAGIARCSPACRPACPPAPSARCSGCAFQSDRRRASTRAGAMASQGRTR
jgi:hypothetical protein